jgi:hypothetical protein
MNLFFYLAIACLIPAFAISVLIEFSRFRLAYPTLIPRLEWASYLFALGFVACGGFGLVRLFHSIL